MEHHFDKQTKKFNGNKGKLFYLLDIKGILEVKSLDQCELAGLGVTHEFIRMGHDDMPVFELKKTYTRDEIVKHFANANLKDEFKWEVGGFVEGIMQAMCNIIDSPEKTMTMSNPGGDYFQEGHNWFVTLYQKHYACDPPVEKQMRKEYHPDYHFFAIIPGRTDPNKREVVYGAIPDELLIDYYICTDHRNTCITLRPKTQLLIKEIK